MNESNDEHRELWVAEQAAYDGARRKLRFGEQLLPIEIPAGCSALILRVVVTLKAAGPHHCL